MINYSDSEVGVYHPICENALNNALRLLGQEKNYRVVHHRYTGALEMDFVIENIITHKYLCVIEVKRTPAAVNSTRYQFQAMSYVQSNVGLTEKPYYILTNFERAILFRYDSARQRTYQQILQPGLSIIGDFQSFDNENDLCDALSTYFKNTIDAILADNYSYFLTLDNFAAEIESIKRDYPKWKSNLALMLYEYIRGAFQYVRRNDLRDIRVFHGNIQKICNEGSRVDFAGIFNYCTTLFDPTVTVGNTLLTELFNYGNQNVTGDSIADTLHQIVSAGHEHEGEVPTDLELAKIVAILAHSVSGDLGISDCICDPAAGSGNLISSAISVYNLRPNQIIANDANQQLLELLSLRLGLNFASSISVDVAPNITCHDISDLGSTYFSNTKVLLVNPPFVAGISCISRKKSLYKAIQKITGEEAITNVGQMPLEAVFLELLTELLPEKTTIACVFPKTHLTARGSEAVKIRELLMSKFGLKKIFIYPGVGIFEDVTKDTCVLVGSIKSSNENIDIIASMDNIPDIDADAFKVELRKNLNNYFTTIIPGIEGKTVNRTTLINSIEDGWREFNIDMIDSISFVQAELASSPKLIQMDTYNFPVKRGGAGNNGGSDLLFLDSNPSLFNSYRERVKLGLGLRNAHIDTVDIQEGDSKFLDSSINSSVIIDSILRDYVSLPINIGRQTRNSKNIIEWKRILDRESRGAFPGNTVLIPRAIRTKGRAYYSKNRVFVSTNFVVCSMANIEQAILLSTWMTTIFYQLICEVSSKDEEGMRKMEVKDILTTLVPNFDTLSDTLYTKIQAELPNISFLELKNPIIRDIDRIWATELFGEDADDKLNEASRLLAFLANRRDV